MLSHSHNNLPLCEVKIKSIMLFFTFNKRLILSLVFTIAKMSEKHFPHKLQKAGGANQNLIF